MKDLPPKILLALHNNFYHYRDNGYREHYEQFTKFAQERRDIVEIKHAIDIALMAKEITQLSNLLKTFGLPGYFLAVGYTFHSRFKVKEE